jgi:hypothetical protein
MSNTPTTGKIHLARSSDAYWRVTFEIPPLNIWAREYPTIRRSCFSVGDRRAVKVVVFDSAVKGFFLTYYDFLAKPEDSAKSPRRVLTECCLRHDDLLARWFRLGV